MGLNNNKKFKSKKTYIIHFIIYIIGITFGIWILFFLINLTEQEVIDIFLSQELIGSAKQRGAQALQRFIIYNFGKRGLLLIMSLIVIGIFYEMLKEFAEYLRFIKKTKLFKQGLVNNLDDDFPRQNVFKFIYRKIVKEKS